MKALIQNLDLTNTALTNSSLYRTKILVSSSNFIMDLANSIVFLSFEVYSVCKLQSMKIPWNLITFSQNSFAISPSLLYPLIRSDTGRLANEAFTSNPIVYSKQ